MRSSLALLGTMEKKKHEQNRVGDLFILRPTMQGVEDFDSTAAPGNLSNQQHL